MKYGDIFSLPQLIVERIDMDEHIDTNLQLADTFHLAGDQEGKMLAIENDILAKKEDLATLPMLLQQKLVIDQKTAEKIAVQLWGNYFLLFQDFLPRVDQLIVKYGGDILGFQERAKKLLSSGRQLRSFMREFLFDSPLERASDGCAGEIIDALINRVIEDDSRNQFVDRVHAIVLKENLPLDAADRLIDNLEGMIESGTITKHWALYYHDLGANVLNAVPGHFDESEAAVDSVNDVSEVRHPSFLFLMQRFEQLPEETRTRLTSQTAQEARKALEQKYHIDLEEFIVRAAIGDFPLSDLSLMIKKEYGLSPEKAGDLTEELRKNFFESLSPAMQDSKTYSQPAIAPMPQASTPALDRVSSPSLPSPSPEEYSRIAGKVISDNHVELTDPALGVRLRQILVTRLKNIRSMVETKEKLIASSAVGGAGLSNDNAESLVRAATIIADQIAKGTYEIPKIDEGREIKIENATDLKVNEPGETTAIVPPSKVPQPTAPKLSPLPALIIPPLSPAPLPSLPPPPPAPPSLAIEEIDGLPMLVEKKFENPNVKPETKKVAPSPKPVAPAIPSLPVPVPISAPLPPFQPQALYHAPTPDYKLTAPPPPSMQGAKSIPVVLRSGASDQIRSKIVDVKPASNKLIDAIEEMRVMTLKDFRRLSQDPAEAIKRIHQKIQLVEKDSVTKKMAAIDAWRENEISVLYREMASMSMSAGGSMQAVIDKRTSEGKDALTEAEFDALLDLNEMLRA